MVRELFRDQASTEFIIATIPTVLGINESARLLQALRKERIPCKRIIVNQARARPLWHQASPDRYKECMGAATHRSAGRALLSVLAQAQAGFNTQAESCVDCGR